MVRKAIAFFATSFVVGTISTAALAVSKRAAATVDRDVRTLLGMMDKDQNGVVSKDEFMQFMGRAFDRIDVDNSGALERRELRQMRTTNWLIPDCVHVAFPQCGGN
jgi:Ca2+-binding EF-hand superfamily protein